MNLNVMYSQKTNEWETPQKLFDELNVKYSFTLDPCATKENAKCKKYYTIADNGLVQSWNDEIVFCNPPYGKEIGKWVEKAYTESIKGATVVMLIPARTDTKYWHEWIFKKAQIIFLKGRLKFGNSKNSAPFPSAIIIFKEVKHDNKSNP